VECAYEAEGGMTECTVETDLQPFEWDRIQPTDR